ncbi:MULTISPECIES: response regulator transcription factor [Corallococcus]|uniref:response regulator transcription factor n=1 Tax=Corallococcus TaxID=83461 RepID=UPI00244C406F|nr:MULTISPECIES: winged helix-turn-helix domain-containing protein [Corallococcus]
MLDLMLPGTYGLDMLKALRIFSEVPVLILGARNDTLDKVRVQVRGRPVELTRVEFELLAALARRLREAVTRQWLVEHVLDPEREGTERTLDVHVSRLRRKLGPVKCVETVWGVGYRLVPGETDRSFLLSANAPPRSPRAPATRPGANPVTPPRRERWRPRTSPPP